MVGGGALLAGVAVGAGVGERGGGGVVWWWERSVVVGVGGGVC